MERGLLTSLFEKYFPSLMNRSKGFCKTTPISEMAMIQMTCYLIECFLNISSTPTSTAIGNHQSQHSHHQEITNEPIESTLEIIFVFAAIWGFGSALHQDHLIDWHREFHKWWTSEFKDVKFPTQGIIFDYYLDMPTKRFNRWETLAANKKFEIPDTYDIPLQVCIVIPLFSGRLSFCIHA